MPGLTVPAKLPVSLGDSEANLRRALSVISVRRITDEDRERFKSAVYAEYNAVAHDAWGDKTPSKAVFVDAMADLLAQGAFSSRHPLTHAERELWISLSAAERRRIILEVGP